MAHMETGAFVDPLVRGQSWYMRLLNESSETDACPDLVVVFLLIFRRVPSVNADAAFDSFSWGGYGALVSRNDMLAYTNALTENTAADDGDVPTHVMWVARTVPASLKLALMGCPPPRGRLVMAVIEMFMWLVDQMIDTLVDSDNISTESGEDHDDAPMSDDGGVSNIES